MDQLSKESITCINALVNIPFRLSGSKRTRETENEVRTREMENKVIMFAIDNKLSLVEMKILFDSKVSVSILCITIII